jgi:hypothetical protein
LPAQLGLHYTSRQDIELIVEPVLMAPLRREWDAIQAEAASLRDAYDSAATTREQQDCAARLPPCATGCWPACAR